MSKAAKIIRAALFFVCAAFCLFSAVYLAVADSIKCIALPLVTLFLLFAPRILEKLLKIRFNLVFFIFSYAYLICVMLGHSYNLYHLIPWWDVMLHFCGGAVFAAVGYCLPRAAGSVRKTNRLACAVFAVCFSMALALGWEFCEYLSDRVFMTDMQQDTFISEIHSYVLSDELGKVGEINVESVDINGGGVVFDRYLDVGLHDTMTDTLFGTAGAFVTAILLFINNDKYKLIVLKNQK